MTAKDHRELTRTLDQLKQPYHLFGLLEDKLLNAFFRGKTETVATQ